ncbi:MAG: hypothetical protein QOG31_1411 [Thermoplasmata archaeon]|jgi:hypothetical protein|nr:hypothetical protein [Thermoplasmata archaeon]
MDQVLLTIGAFIIGLFAQCVTDTCIATLHTIPRVNRDIAAAETRLGARLDALLKPGVMRGGVDPTDAAALRWQKAEEKRLTALATKVEVKTLIAQRFGPDNVARIEAFLGPDTMQGVYESGARWKPILEPFLRTVPHMNDATKENTWRPA